MSEEVKKRQGRVLNLCVEGLAVAPEYEEELDK